jgi:hypothetical protein
MSTASMAASARSSPARRPGQTVPPPGSSWHQVLERSLNWDTTADKATIAGAVLCHWLGRQPDQADLHEFLDTLAAEWVTGQPWQLTGEQLEQAGFEP